MLERKTVCSNGLYECNMCASQKCNPFLCCLSIETPLVSSEYLFIKIFGRDKEDKV